METKEKKTRAKRIPKVPSDVPAAYVSYKKGATINIGNYESERVEIMASLPCSPDVKSMSSACDTVKKLVEEELSKEIAKIKSNSPIGGKGSGEIDFGS